MIRKLRALLLFYRQLAGFSSLVTLALAGVMLADPEALAFVSCIKLFLSVVSLALYRHSYAIRFFFLHNLGLHTWEIIGSLLVIDYLIFLLIIQCTTAFF